MKAYVINLEKNSERLQKISKRLTELAVSYNRVEAIWGRALSEAQKHSLCSFFLWWTTHGYRPRAGQIGCSLSHLKAAQAILDSGDAFGCILEDDAILCDGFPDQIARLEQELPVDRPQVVLLSDHHPDGDNSQHLRRVNGGSFAEGYIVNRKAAAALIRANTPLRCMNDNWSFWVNCNRGKGILELYQAYPPVVLQEWQKAGYVSDVCPEGEKRIDAAGFAGLKRIFWKMNRALGKLISYCLTVPGAESTI